MSRAALVGSVAALALGLAINAGAAPITDEASAIQEAKKYTKAQCTTGTPCTYTVKREGSQWNVWVELTRRAAPGQKPQPYHGGHVILYFDGEGRLVKRIKGE